jgi:catechol-2,3-dioxygenase
MEVGHVGLFVRDFDKMLDFYVKYFGLAITDIVRGPQRSIVFLTTDPTSHHQLVLVTGRPEGEGPKLVNQLSFRLKTLAELRRVYARFVEDKMPNLDPVTHGIAWSVYLPDPEGNRIEAYVDTPWYVTQPFRTAIDLTKSEADLVSETEALCRGLAGFEPMSVWTPRIAQQIRPL